MDYSDWKMGLDAVTFIQKVGSGKYGEVWKAEIDICNKGSVPKRKLSAVKKISGE